MRYMLWTRVVGVFLCRASGALGEVPDVAPTAPPISLVTDAQRMFRAPLEWVCGKPYEDEHGQVSLFLRGIGGLWTQTPVYLDRLQAQDRAQTQAQARENRELGKNTLSCMAGMHVAGGFDAYWAALSEHQIFSARAKDRALQTWCGEVQPNPERTYAKVRRYKIAFPGGRGAFPLIWSGKFPYQDADVDTNPLRAIFYHSSPPMQAAEVFGPLVGRQLCMQYVFSGSPTERGLEISFPELPASVNLEAMSEEGRVKKMGELQSAVTSWAARPLRALDPSSKDGTGLRAFLAPMLYDLDHLCVDVQAPDQGAADPRISLSQGDSGQCGGRFSWAGIPGSPKPTPSEVAWKMAPELLGRIKQQAGKRACFRGYMRIEGQEVGRAESRPEARFQALWPTALAPDEVGAAEQVQEFCGALRVRAGKGFGFDLVTPVARYNLNSLPLRDARTTKSQEVFPLVQALGRKVCVTSRDFLLEEAPGEGFRVDGLRLAFHPPRF